MIDEIAKLAQLVIDLKSSHNVIAFNIHGDKFCVMLACGFSPFKQYPNVDEYAKLTKENLIEANNWLGREYESDDENNAEQWKCTKCGRIGSVGRCCGVDTRTPEEYK